MSRRTRRQQERPIAKSRHERVTGRSTLRIVGVGVLALAAAVISVRNAFTQDDISIIAESTRLHGFSAWREILSQPYWPPPASPDLYRPVLSLFLAAQYVIGGGDAFAFHLVSILLYASAAVS